MNTRNHRYIISAFYVSVLFALSLDLAPKTDGQADLAKATAESRGGLKVVTFGTPNGRVIVNLPDDIIVGDTISGTVIAEPKGQSSEERARNRSELNALVVEIDGKPMQPFTTPSKERDAVIQQTFWIYHVDAPKVKLVPNAPATSIFLPISLVNNAGQVLAQTTIPTGLITGVPDGNIPVTWNIPPLGQAGRPVVISGPFDGNASNTTLRATVQDFEKNTENVSGGFGLLAESPRKAIFSSPTNVTGPIEITLNEGSQQKKGNYRNVGVNLSAPKTSLLKGESTELRVEVNGLQGITEPVPLHLVKGGVVTLQGGDVQTLSIKPSEVRNGIYTTTRTITGVQTGSFSITATVVVFNVCLQDDNNGNSIIFNRDTGDYTFCAGAGNRRSANPISLGTLDFSGAVVVQTREIYDSMRKAQLFNLEHIAPDRNVSINFNPGSYSGTAIIRTTNPKQKFTITDRDTRNNTCSCK
jgi:hypothetical protein